MKIEEYRASLETLKRKFNEDKFNLAKQFALANNPVKIGDLVADESGMIKVEKIGVYRSFNGEPGCTYTGPKYTVSGKPYKNGAIATIYRIITGKGK